MAFNESIVNVDISLQTTPVTVAGFGTPIFASEHRWFTERVRSYSSIEAVAADIPTNSNEYAAAQGYFSSTPSPDLIKIGRREVTTITLDVEDNTAVTTYTATITAPSDTDYPATYTTGAAPEGAIAIATALYAAGGWGAIGDMTVTDGLDGTITITAAVGDWTISDVSAPTSGADGIDILYTTSTETAADMVEAIQAVDDEWYMISSNDHSADFISTATTGMADVIEAKEKLFFFSSQSADSLETYEGDQTPTDDDVLGWVRKDEKLRTIGIFHQEADTSFPECNYVGKFAPFTPGTIVWTQKNIGVSLSEDPDTGNVLNSTQLINLAARKSGFIQSIGGVAAIREGKSAQGERVDVLRFRDFLVARITEAYQIQALNTFVTPYTDSGINTKRSVLETVLQRYVTTPGNPQGLQEINPFTTSFPKRRDVDPSDVTAGILSGEFVGFLRGAILITNIKGSLTYEGLA